jgi:hypothetical protein
LKYITGIHALNLPCSLETCGDWHCSALRWKNLSIAESEGSIFGEYGIEHGTKIPEHTELYHCANTIRALLDLLIEENYAVAQGMNNDYICNDQYTPEVFKKVSMLKHLDHWQKINHFMGREYRTQWLDYIMGCKDE